TFSPGSGFSSDGAGTVSVGGCTSSGTVQVERSSAGGCTLGRFSACAQPSTSPSTTSHPPPLRVPLRLTRPIKGRDTEPQTVVQCIGQCRGPVASHRECPGPLRGLYRGLCLLRTGFRP